MRYPFLTQMLLPIAFTTVAGCCNCPSPPVTLAPAPAATPVPLQKIADNHRVSVTTVFESAVGSPTEQQLFYPAGLGIDAQGTLYMSDASSRLVKIGGEGTLQEVAGAAVRLPWGPWEGGFVNAVGRDARFNGPMGLAVDASGDIVVADAENHRLRRVTPSGNATTLVGSGVRGYQDGVGSTAQFNRPAHLAIDANGAIFVSEWGAHRIRRIDPDGTVTTIAGTGEQGFADGPASQAKFNTPQGIAVAPDGTLYVADSLNHRIRRIKDGMVTTFAGDGTKGYNDGLTTRAKFGGVWGVVRMRNGDLIVSDASNHSLRRVSTLGMVTTIVGGGKVQQSQSRSDVLDGLEYPGFIDGDESTAKFHAPLAVALDSSEQNLYVCDSFNHAIRKIAFIP